MKCRNCQQESFRLVNFLCPECRGEPTSGLQEKRDNASRDSTAKHRAVRLLEAQAHAENALRKKGVPLRVLQDLRAEGLVESYQHSNSGQPWSGVIYWRLVKPPGDEFMRLARELREKERITVIVNPDGAVMRHRQEKNKQGAWVEIGKTEVGREKEARRLHTLREAAMRGLLDKPMYAKSREEFEQWSKRNSKVVE